MSVSFHGVPPIPKEGQLLVGPLFNEPMPAETVRSGGLAVWTMGLVGSRTHQFRRVQLSEGDLSLLRIVETTRSFDGDPQLLKLAIRNNFGRQATYAAAMAEEHRRRVKTSTYPLRLPVSLKLAWKNSANRTVPSVNQFVVTAVAEKISTVNTATFFEERRAKSDRAGFRRILNRKGGEPPRQDDKI